MKLSQKLKIQAYLLKTASFEKEEEKYLFIIRSKLNQMVRESNLGLKEGAYLYLKPNINLRNFIARFLYLLLTTQYFKDLNALLKLPPLGGAAPFTYDKVLFDLTNDIVGRIKEATYNKGAQSLKELSQIILEALIATLSSEKVQKGYEAIHLDPPQLKSDYFK